MFELLQQCFIFDPYGSHNANLATHIGTILNDSDEFPIVAHNRLFESRSMTLNSLNLTIVHSIKSVDYTQDHGWVTRGNISIPEVKADVDDAIQRALDFANDYKYDYNSASILAQSLISLIICINL